MYKVYFFGFFFMIIFASCQSRLTMHNNEWIPLTSDEVFARSRIIPDGMPINQFPFKHGEKSDINNYKDESVIKTKIHPGSEDVHFHNIRNRAIKLVRPGTTQLFNYENILKSIEPDTIRSVNELQNVEEECNKLDCQNGPKSTINRTDIVRGNRETLQVVPDINRRQPKTIAEDGSINKVTKNLLTAENPEESDIMNVKNNFQRRITKDIGQEDNPNLYKVVEDTNESLDDIDIVDTKPSGYFYPQPKPHFDDLSKNDFTDKFIDILSRHNIRPEDELPNYTLSRRVESKGPVNTLMLIPLRFISQFNNFKQLSVNPLLAVLMSNYGYYYPGLYGIHSRYRNLYGHLAANNIHNNKPFGSYKIYSDTDSSN